MVDGSDASPKGVAEMSLDTVVDKIRDRREAVMDGRITPSTVPNFPNAPPSTPVRQSLVSIDDEEVNMYHIEITTDNVVKSPVPARFSQSGAEEYLAEFDMVDTEGAFILPAPRPLTPIGSLASSKRSSKTPKSKQEETGDAPMLPPRAEKKATVAKPGGLFASLRKRTYSLEDASTGIEASPSHQSGETTVRDLVGAPPSPSNEKTEAVGESTSSPVEKAVDTQAAPQQAEKKTVNAKDTPQQAERKTSDDKATPVAEKEKKATVAKPGGLFASLRKRTYSLEDASTGIEASPSQQSGEKTVRDLVGAPPSPSKEKTEAVGESTSSLVEKKAVDTPAAEKKSVDEKVAPASEKTVDAKSTPKQTEKKAVDSKSTSKHSGGVFSALRRRTHSGKSLSRRKSTTEDQPVDVPTVKKSYTESSIEWDDKTKTPVPSADSEKDETDSATKSSGPATDTEVPLGPKPDTTGLVTQTTPVDLDESVVDSKKATPGPVDLDESIADSKQAPSPPADKSTSATKTSPEDDETKSTMTSSTESIMASKPPPKFPGEAAMEALLEKFFDKVTCTCINDRCDDRCVTTDEKEVPNYMVVEIQKIHEKAQAKKAEIAEKKHARRNQKVKQPKENGARKATKDALASMKERSTKLLAGSKKGGEGFEMQQAPPQRKHRPPPEWGEKVLDQDSVTTASSAPLPTGVTVGQFLQNKFSLLEKSIRKKTGDQSESADEESAGEYLAESEVEESSMEELMDGAILNITPVNGKEAKESAPVKGAVQTISAKKGVPAQDPEQRVIVLSQAEDVEDGSESLLDAEDADADSLLEDDESEYTTELIKVDFDPSKLGNKTDADMYLAREVLRRYAEITGISLDELIEDVVDESLASLTLDAYGFPVDREGSLL